jgi:hypothetical protein
MLGDAARIAGSNGGYHMDWDLILTVLPFVAAGFAALLIDGALGLAFGVISSTWLISL